MWEQIRYNQTMSVALVVGMGLLLLLLGYLLGVISGTFFFQTPFIHLLIIPAYVPWPHSLSIFDVGILGVIIAAIAWAIASLITYFRGDNILLGLSKAKKFSLEDSTRLYNIIDEMKIASGLEAMPAMYIIDDPAPNAFAIGRDPKKAAVIVTSGLLTKLNRDELQGVIGHEIAHIKNRDVLLMVMCSVLFFTMIFLARLPGNLSWGRATGIKNSSSESALSDTLNLFIIFFAIFLVVYIFLMIFLQFHMPSTGIIFSLVLTPFIMAVLVGLPFVALIIYYTLSRRREYLADASSALYTRYPAGLASALEKIASANYQMLNTNPATSPLYIVNPLPRRGKQPGKLTWTHPPISERIRILRAMAYASYADYDLAYRQIRNINKSIIPDAVLAAAGSSVIRAAVPDELDHIQRARETSNLLWNLNNYRTINCACGTKMRLPPGFKLSEVRCPHCGAVIAV
jgi:heat shock protein HtpX